MKQRPIPFSVPMVRAILSGSKTQTRRLVKLKPHQQIEERDDGTPWPWMHDGDRDADHWLPCPYGQPCDRLWVREPWKAHTTFDHLPPRDIPPSHVWYMADKGYKAESRHRHGMFMPRWASRITLIVTSVRVERLQDISRLDALVEGIVMLRDGGFGLADTTHYHAADPRQSYWSLWEAINGPGSVEANPWVWVVEFLRVTP